MVRCGRSRSSVISPTSGPDGRLGDYAGTIMRRKLTCWELLAVSGLIVLTGLGSSVAGAQTSSHTQTAQPASATSGSGDYYV